MPLFSGRGDGWNITYAVASEAARFSAAPPPLHGSIFPPAAYTPPNHGHAPRAAGGHHTDQPRPGDNINHRGGGGTCKEGDGPTTAPVCCSMATVTRCNRFYGSTSTPYPRNRGSALNRFKMRLRPLLPFSLHPLVYCVDDILIHALSSGRGSFLYIVFLAFRHPNSNFV